jgi:hypothetical protein
MRNRLFRSRKPDTCHLDTAEPKFRLSIHGTEPAPTKSRKLSGQSKLKALACSNQTQAYIGVSADTLADETGFTQSQVRRTPSPLLYQPPKPVHRSLHRSPGKTRPKLEPQRAAIQVVVIDHIEKPSAN